MAALFLMSVKPIYLRRILKGTKGYELRRSPARMQFGDVVILYGSAPLKAIAGAFLVGRVLRGSPFELWKQYGDGFGVTFDEYSCYFHNASAATAIQIGRFIEVAPIGLNQLREKMPGFRPPQSYARWRTDPALLLGKPGLDKLLAPTTSTTI